MHIKQLSVRRFRGFDSISVRPSKNVLLCGEPRAGRSNLVEALIRVLDPDSTRRSLDVWDFHGGDVTARIDIEVTLGGLGASLEHQFAGHLEVWERSGGEFVASAADPDDLDPDTHEWVLRLAYRARWDVDEDQGEQWVDYPKESDPDAGRIVRASRRERQLLPFIALTPSRPLAIRAEGRFRRLLADGSGSADLAAALDDLEEAVTKATTELSESTAVADGLKSVLDPLRPTLKTSRPTNEIVRYVPDGGTIAGLLRALTPAMNLDQPDDFLPIDRHGSTLPAMLAIAEADLLETPKDAVVVVDDFADLLDAASAEYLAARLHRQIGQVWLSTRRADVARAFDPTEVIRLTTQPSTAHAIPDGAWTSMRAALRQLHLQLLPAMTARTLIICEGRHDSTVLRAVTARRLARAGITPLTAHSVRFVDSGGIDEIPKLAQLARTLGFRTVALLDHDKPGLATESKLAKAEAEADAVVRLPNGFAIERALTHGVDPAHLRVAMATLRSDFALPWPDPASLGDSDIGDYLTQNLKARSGLHEEFIRALPKSVYSPVLIELLKECERLAGGADETVQMTV